MLQVRWWHPIMCDHLVLACHHGATAAAAGTASQTVRDLLSFSPTIDAYVSSSTAEINHPYNLALDLFFATYGQSDYLYCLVLNGPF